MIIQTNIANGNKIAGHKKIAKQVSKSKGIKKRFAQPKTGPKKPDKDNCRNFSKPIEITPNYLIHSYLFIQTFRQLKDDKKYIDNTHDTSRQYYPGAGIKIDIQPIANKNGSC